MGYNTAEAVVNGSKAQKEQMVRLAEVTSLDNKRRAKVKFFGEDAEAGKTYTYIEGYIPAVGDKVLMLCQGNTFVIMGAVVEKEVVVKYALKDHDHSETYVETTVFEEYKLHTHSKLVNGKKTVTVTSDSKVVPGADGEYSLGTSSAAFAEGYIDNIVVTYVTIGDTKLEKSDLISKIIASGNDAYYVVLEDTNLTPYANQGISLGTALKMFKNVYAQSIYLNGLKINPARLVDAAASGRYMELSSSVLAPSTNEIISIGSASKRFKEAYAKTIHGDVINAEQINLDGQKLYPYRMVSDTYPASKYIDFSNDTLLPNANNAYNIGSSSRQYKAMYSQNLYVNGSAVTTSDKRKKKFVRNLEDKYVKLFKKLRPVTFKYKNGTSGRKHAGFIAQEVEQAMNECGISNEEFGGLVIQENGEYGLRYEEFIALQTAAIQDLQKKVEDLEGRLKNDRV